MRKFSLTSRLRLEPLHLLEPNLQQIQPAGILLLRTVQKSPKHKQHTAAALRISKHRRVPSGFGSSRSVFTDNICLLSSAKKLGVTEVPLEVVNFISHATQSRLRSLLEKVSAVAQHRTDGGKVRVAHSHESPTA